MRGKILSTEFYGRVRDAVEFTERHPRNTARKGIRRNANNRNNRFYVKFTEDLESPSSAESDPTTAMAVIMRMTAELNLAETTDTIKIYNHLPELSFVIGDVTKVEWLDGNWSPYVGGGGVKFGTVDGCLGNGFHTVTLYDEAPPGSTSAGSSSGWGDCAGCGDGCTEPTEPSINGPTEAGETVIGFSTIRVPLVDGGVCIVGNPIADSEGNLVYPILDAEKEIVILKEEDYECCDDGSLAVKRQRYIMFEGCVSDWCDQGGCNPTPSGTPSSSNISI